MQSQEKVAVLGASGLVGRAVSDALLNRGNYAVNGLMRNPEKMVLNHVSLKIMKGDVNNQSDVEQALEGCIAVVVTIMRPLEVESKIFTNAAKVISAACKKMGVRRVVYVGAIAMVNDNGSYYYQRQNFPPLFLDASLDHMGALKYYQDAGLDVTVICPPKIFDSPFSGKYAIDAEKEVENNKWHIGNGEIADFILKEIQNPQYVGKRVSITDTD